VAQALRLSCVGRNQEAQAALAAARTSGLAVTALLLKLGEVGIGLCEERPDARVLSSCLELRRVYHRDDLIGQIMSLARCVGVEC
jgi:hypothetical protein